MKIRTKTLRALINAVPLRVICFTLLTLPMSVYGQDVSDCGLSFKTEFKSIEKRRFEKKLSEAAADSLRELAFATFESCLIGKALPEIELTSVSGGVHSSASLIGKTVMLNIWSTSCGPCIGEIPVLNRIATSYKGNENFLLLSILVESEEQFSKFLTSGLTKRRIEFEVAAGAKSILKDKLKFVEAYPTTLFLDDQGKVYDVLHGGITDRDKEEWLENKYRTIIEKRLKE